VRYPVFVFILLLCLAGCKSEPKQGRGIASPKVKNVKLELISIDNSRVHYGDTIRVRMSFEADTAVQRISLVTQRGDVAFNQSDSLEFWMATTTMGGGYHSLRAEVVQANGVAMRGSLSLRVVLPEAPAEWGYRLIEVYPHDDKSYTQGLLYHQGELYESAGRYGMSDIRKVRLTDGEVITKNKVADDYFAEGLALHNGQLYQLTWREKLVFVYDLSTLEKQREFSYNVGNGEGWGLTSTGEEFIFSDGSADLYFLNPDDWTINRQLRVFDHQGDVLRLNEMEYVAGKIYANILDSRLIAVIDPVSGGVLAYWNLEGLLESQPRKNRVDVMNGIAYRTDGSSFLITGKLWPYLFEIQPVFN